MRGGQFFRKMKKKLSHETIPREEIKHFYGRLSETKIQKLNNICLREIYFRSKALMANRWNIQVKFDRYAPETITVDNDTGEIRYREIKGVGHC
jgi:hypothetical protein